MPFDKSIPPAATAAGGAVSGSAFTKKKLRNSVFSQAATKEGYMSKQSTGFFKRWQTRYFTLAGHYLSYYQDEKKEESVKGAIDIAALEGVELSDEGGCWEITNKGQITKLKCQTKAQAEEWVNAIKESVAKSGSQENAAAKTASPTSATAVEHSAFKVPKMLFRHACRIEGSHFLLQCFCDDAASNKLQVRGIKVGGGGNSVLQWEFSDAVLKEKYGSSTPWEGSTKGAWFTSSGILTSLMEKDAVAVTASK